MAANERVVITREKADEMMPPGKYVHTFAQSGGLLIGCDIKREEILAHADSGRLELAGPTATAMKHGLCIMGSRLVFVATKEEVK